MPGIDRNHEGRHDEVEARCEAKDTIIGVIGTLRDLGFTNAEILSRITAKYHLTEAEAESYVLATA